MRGSKTENVNYGSSNISWRATLWIPSLELKSGRKCLRFSFTLAKLSSSSQLEAQVNRVRLFTFSLTAFSVRESCCRSFISCRDRLDSGRLILIHACFDANCFVEILVSPRLSFQVMSEDSMNSLEALKADDDASLHPTVDCLHEDGWSVVHLLTRD